MMMRPILPTIRILVVGAGIGGLAFVRQLKKLKKINISVKIIEKRTSLSTDSTGIAVPANAVKALTFMGLGDKLHKQAHQVTHIVYTDSAGSVLSEASLLDKPLNINHFVALHRHQLHDILRDGIDEAIQFGTKIEKMTQTKNSVLVKFNNNEKQEEFNLVIGADGVNSSVRQLAFADASLTDLGVTIWRWTCKYSTDHLQPTYLLGGRELFMVYPISKNEVYCYAHTFDPDNFLSKLPDHKNNLNKQFAHFGGIAKTMLGILPDNQLIIPGRLRSVAKPLFASRRVALIGDAGHACSPMLQQGAAGALEDAISLALLIKHFPIEEALSHYEKFRSERVNWISASSDGPMKMLINMDATLFLSLQQKIRDNGPLNVQGWKKLLADDPLHDISTYIEKHKVNDEQKSSVSIRSKL